MDAEKKSASAPDAAPQILDFLARLYFPLFLILIALATWQPLTGAEDFWAHIAVGRWIWENQSVPHHTLWLWSTPGQQWIAHAWLSELFLFGLMKIGGAHLVLLATIFFVAAPFVCFWKVWARKGKINFFAALFFGFSVWCAHVRFQPRPELFSYFLLGALLCFLMESPRDITRKNAFAVIAIFALWANLHGAVALGLVVLFVTAASELAQQKFARPAWKLFALALACACAINFNPYGFAYWGVLRPVGGAMFSMIDEWKSPLAHPALPLDAIGFVVTIAIIAVWAWMKNPERRWAQLAWLVLAVALFFSARRNLWPCVLMCVAVAAANAKGLRLANFSGVPIRARVLARACAVAILLSGALISFSPEAIAPASGVLQVRATSRLLPRGATDVVLKENLPTPIFNDYLRSGYFHWRFSGRPELYIDLHNQYPPALLENYFDIIKRAPRGQAEWEKLKINTVIFGSYRAKDRLAPLAAYLHKNPDWQEIYNAEDGAVWVRKTARK